MTGGRLNSPEQYQYLTNSKISCFSSNCFSSLRDNRWGRPAAVRPTPAMVGQLPPAVLLAPVDVPHPDSPQLELAQPFIDPWPADRHGDSLCVSTLKNVGVPSMDVFTIGFNKPPLSNSCADIFLQRIRGLKFTTRSHEIYTFHSPNGSRRPGAAAG